MNADLQDLEAKAKVKGHALLEKQDWWRGDIRLVPFSEITHYFDENMRELGYHVSFSGNVHLFNPPRIWAKEFLAKCELRTIIH